MYEIPNFSDFCCYWFELSRQAIREHPTTRAGLLATQGIRGGANRSVLERIKRSGGIFMAWSDRDWVLDGANVHVSLVGFDNGSETTAVLDGRPEAVINANLAAGADLTMARPTAANLNLCLIGVKKAGHFNMPWEEARTLLAAAGNPAGASNGQVMRPVLNGIGVTRRPIGQWIVDFGNDLPLEEAAAYEAPFKYVHTRVLPERAKNKRKLYRERWWLYAETRPTMRLAQTTLPRCLITAYVTKYRLFAWLPSGTVPADGLFLFARSDDYFFGVLHSSIHELWARRMGTQLREVESGFRYTPTTCFETFPLPWPPGAEPLECGGSDAALASRENTLAERNSPFVGKAASGPPHSIEAPPSEGAIHAAISQAAKELNEMRERWLNPPEWIEPIAAGIDALDKFEDVPAEARPLIRQSAIMAAAAKDPNLKKRTLTNLYNERPTWLKLAHRKLDEAVLAAYAAIDPDGGWSPDWADVWFDTGAGQALPPGHPLTAPRAGVDQQVLANLLRLNGMRANG